MVKMSRGESEVHVPNCYDRERHHALGLEQQRKQRRGQQRDIRRVHSRGALRVLAFRALGRTRRRRASTPRVDRGVRGVDSGRARVGRDQDDNISSTDVAKPTARPLSRIFVDVIGPETSSPAVVPTTHPGSTSWRVC